VRQQEPPVAVVEAARGGEAQGAPSGRPQIEVQGVSRWFKGGQVHALDRITFDVAAGEFVSVVGPSGCGKTTLLRVIDGLIKPDAGRVLIAGHPPVPGPQMGFVFQQARLLPWRTVRANVEFPLFVQGVPADERRERAMNVLATVGLQAFANAYPHELSGGALDAMTRQFMRLELLRLWARLRTAVVFVTHDIDEAILLSNRIVVLRPRPGQVDEIVRVDLPEDRWEGDVEGLQRFRELHDHLWHRIRSMVGQSAEWATSAQGGGGRGGEPAPGDVRPGPGGS
jgi:NitT/TauT family transport system ATP-binding protein